MLTGHLQADHPEQDLYLAAPAVRNRRRSPFRQPEVPLRRLQRPPRRLISRDDRGQLGIRGAGLGGKPGQERMHGRGLPAQDQAGPVVGEQPAG